MAKSMTGYGKSQCTSGSKTLIVEIRSLNSKYLDLNLKMPSNLKEAEASIRKMCHDRIVRGKVDLSIGYEDSENPNIGINKGLFKAYALELKKLARASDVPADDLLRTIVTLPNVVQAESGSIDEESMHLLEKVAEQAIDQLENFRSTEGQSLAADLKSNCKSISALLPQVEELALKRTAKLKDKIRENLKQSEITLDENRLEQELIFYVEKLDISEELVRLEAHCAYFCEVLDSAVQVKGKKLNFISQEMGREINTIGSKANDQHIQQIVVGMKEELEKIKEQLMNML